MVNLPVLVLVVLTRRYRCRRRCVSISPSFSVTEPAPPAQSELAKHPCQHHWHAGRSLYSLGALGRHVSDLQSPPSSGPSSLPNSKEAPTRSLQSTLAAGTFPSSTRRSCRLSCPRMTQHPAIRTLSPKLGAKRSGGTTRSSLSRLSITEGTLLHSRM